MRTAAENMARAEYIAGYDYALGMLERGCTLPQLRSMWDAYYPQRPQTQFAIGFQDGINDTTWQNNCRLAGIDDDDPFSVNGLRLIASAKE